MRKSILSTSPLFKYICLNPVLSVYLYSNLCCFHTGKREHGSLSCLLILSYVLCTLALQQYIPHLLGSLPFLQNKGRCDPDRAATFHGSWLNVCPGVRKGLEVESSVDKISYIFSCSQQEGRVCSHISASLGADQGRCHDCRCCQGAQDQ